MPLRRPSTSEGKSAASSSPSSSLGTKRRFPLLGRKKNRNSDLIRPSTGIPSVLSLSPSPSTPSTAATKKPGLRVHVQVKFEGSVAPEHVRDYEASSQLVASDRICQALISRLQHCSAELISRHDCSALDPLRKPHRDVKPLRYRITYRVEREGLTLVEKTLRSFQEYPPTADDAREVVAATDRIVGLFFTRHDPGFKWADSPENEPVDHESETVRPCTGRPQSTSCIPRSRFVHTSQSFELVPGYTIELFLRSRCATRYPENRNASIKIDSRQATPLTLLLGEELTTRASNLITDPIDSWKRKFDKRHRSCNGFEGSGGCQHVEDGAVDVMVKVRNNLGPDYNYFSHRIQTSKVLFNDPNGRDFDEFANAVKAKLEKARDMSDKSLRSMDDLTLRIRELRGKNWSVHEPLIIRLDSSVTYCRQTVEAIMERLQSGISNVLEGHEDALAIMTAHKRGHLIFDGFLDGAGGDDSVHYDKYTYPDLERKALESKLKERIRADITMLCKDTCSVDCTDFLPNLKMRVSSASAGPAGPREVPKESARNARPASERSLTESVGSHGSDHTLAKKQAQRNLRETSLTPSLAPSVAASVAASLAPSSPASPPPADLARVPSGVEMAKKYGYMADYIADDENLSEPPSTPSLVDTDSISPRDNILVTPQSSRAMHHNQSNEGLRIIDDGRRIIYEEQSDADAIAHGVTEFHRYPEDEPIQLVKERLPETPERRATRRSLDTRMPDLSGNPDSASQTANPTSSSTLQTGEKLKDPAVIVAAKESEEPIAELPKQPIPVLVTGETRSEEPVAKPADVPVPVVEPIKTETETEPAVESIKPDEAVPKEANVNSVFETIGEVAPVEKPVSAAEDLNKEAQEKTLKPVVAQETAPREAVEESKEVNDGVQVNAEPEVKVESSTDAEKPVSVTPVVGVEPVGSSGPHAADEVKDNTILDSFPEPPHEHQAHTEMNEEVGRETTEAPKVVLPLVEEPTKEAIQTTEDPALPVAKTSAVNVKERHGLSDTAASVEETLQPEAVRCSSSSDSGISMEEQSREEEHKQELDGEVSKEKEPELPVTSETIESQSVPPKDSYFSSEATVPEDAEYLSLGSSPMLAPVPEEDDEVIKDEIDIARDDSSTEDRPVLHHSHSVPLEKMITPEERFPAPSSFEELPEPRFEHHNLPPVLTRPRTNTLPERRYSTALTLEISNKPFASHETSPTDPPPKSAMGLGFRPSIHRRQPSAGYIGLREQRMHEVGLRNALVPYRLRNARHDQENSWGSRPNTSYSEQ
ncbi:hypothetical protein AK830_g11598 [Neonectria ditissima]|uniref:Pt repeat family protein n=1 Tax=Neonectria ditissima TaxID=78410 RepID=A0A0P7AR13_9HYPO|nr:hypothetical protein AK830_g11598 [Neonectria ditissima]